MSPPPRRLPRRLAVVLAVTVATAVPGPAGAPAAPGGEAASGHPPAVVSVTAVGTPDGAYPRRTELDEPVAHAGDASRRLGLAAYHDLAPRLNDLQARSERVSVEVVGRTPGGRDLYLVTLTAPEGPTRAARQASFRRRIVDQPASAATDAALARDYKLPVLVTANVHGDEWEGTDAGLRLIEEYATSDDPQVAERLRRLRLHVLLSVNPDGRVAGTRENAAGFDLNRDLLTTSQPESVALRDTIVRVQPAVVVDVHGYVNGTLVDPGTGPHGENHEHDLFFRHTWANALGIEQAIRDLGYTSAEHGVAPPQIPLRDWHEGWDDWAPIYTPQYAALHGAVAAHTVELPLRVNRADHDRPVAEVRRRAAINTDIAHAALSATVAYADQHRPRLLADHIEVFRRGAAGEQPRPADAVWHAPVDPRDVVATPYPRAYVIPAGAAQRSAPAADRLARHLLAHDVVVHRATTPFVAGGRRHPAGSLVVDLHQGKRGLARAMLGPGTDLSERVTRVYDVAGWSPGLLWGADVVAVPQEEVLPAALERVDAVPGMGQVPDGGDLVLALDDPADVTALNALLALEAEARLLPGARVVIDGGHRGTARVLASELGVRFAPATGGQRGSAPLRPITIAAAAEPEELWALAGMGFKVIPVDRPTLDDGFDWTGVDVLYVSRRLPPGRLTPPAREALERFLEAGGDLVGQGVAGAELNAALDLIEVDAVTGSAGANGVVRVTSGSGPVGARAAPHTFVEAPLWFRSVGPDVLVEQRFAATPLVTSGHWRPTAGAGGPDSAAGQPVVVSGVTEGTAVVLFGSDPLFRGQPKGQLPLVARALLWASVTDGSDRRSTTAVVPPAGVEPALRPF